MALRLNSPAFQVLHLKGSSSSTMLQKCLLSFRANGICKTNRPRPSISCVMNMSAGQSDESGKFNVDRLIGEARKLWDASPQPVKNFPWERAFENFVQILLDLVLAVIKYLTLPVLFVTSVSEMSYCAHERKLFLIPIPFLFGAVVAGVLRTAALESSQSLRNATVPWHLIAIGIFFTLLKLPGPYYPYWGRIFIPHLANGALWRTVWLAFMWYRRPSMPSETTIPDSVVGDGEEAKL